MIRFKQKKASHVGMILSFVIFITFLVFLFSITQPVTQRERGKEDLLEYLKTELVNEFSVKMTTVTINVEEGVDDCIKIPVIKGIQDNENAIVKNGKTLEVLEHSQDNYIEIKRNSADVVKIYYSLDFPEKTESMNCNVISSNDYSIGLIRTNEYIFETEIKNMIEDFEGNYSSIKGKFEVASGDNFGFSFKDNEGGVIETESKNVSTNVYVEEVPVQYVDSKANIKAGFLSIKVW